MPVSLAVGTVAVVAGTAIAALGWHRWRTRARRALARDLEAALADAIAPGTGSHLEAPPSVRRLVVVDNGNGEQPVYVPIIRIDLETTDAPGTKLVLEYVAEALEAIHPVLEERVDRVAHYDVEFSFGPDGLFVEGECRRVSVPPALADRLLEDDRYGAFELWRDVKRGDRDDATPTTLWGACRSASRLSRDRASTDEASSVD